MYGGIRTLDEGGKKYVNRARRASEVKRITLRGGNICTNGREERKRKKKEMKEEETEERWIRGRNVTK